MELDLILKKKKHVLHGRYNYYTICSTESTETQRVNDLPEFTKVLKDNA